VRRGDSWSNCSDSSLVRNRPAVAAVGDGGRVREAVLMVVRGCNFVSHPHRRLPPPHAPRAHAHRSGGGGGVGLRRAATRIALHRIASHTAWSVKCKRLCPSVAVTVPYGVHGASTAARRGPHKVPLRLNLHLPWACSPYAEIGVHIVGMEHCCHYQNALATVEAAKRQMRETCVTEVTLTTNRRPCTM
jgi:hypothetical protein